MKLKWPKRSLISYDESSVIKPAHDEKPLILLSLMAYVRSYFSRSEEA